MDYHGKRQVGYNDFVSRRILNLEAKHTIKRVFRSTVKLLDCNLNVYLSKSTPTKISAQVLDYSESLLRYKYENIVDHRKREIKW